MANKSYEEFSEGRKPLRELEFEIRSEVYDGLISPEEAHRRLCLLAAKIRRHRSPWARQFRRELWRTFRWLEEFFED